MKWKICALAAIVTATLISCGNNSSDKETPTPVDTAATVNADSITNVIDSLTDVALNVPVKTKAAFDEKYPKATNVQWKSNKPVTQKDGTVMNVEDGVDWELTGWQEMDDDDHQAWFHWQGNESRAYYDDKSNWVGTVDMISDPASLPAAVTQSVNKQFAGYTVVSAKRENDKNRTAFEITLEKGSEKIKALIAENGTLIKKKNVK